MAQGPGTLVNAIDGFSEPLERLHAALAASCVVGTWDWDHLRGTVVYDAGAARLLAGDSALAEREIAGIDAVAMVHPGDHAWLIEHVQQAVRTGGLLLTEYRVVAQDGAVRWLLCRGRTYQDAAGQPLRSRGILIDITEMRDGGERYVLSNAATQDDPLERVADLAIALKRTLDDDTPAEVRAAADVLLFTLGRAIARASTGH